MEPLVFYAAVVKNRTILADYRNENCGDFVQIAARCLEQVPPFHSKFSYTTGNRMFICLIEGLFIYCAVMDEALGKMKATMFLQHVRDAFKVLLQQKDVEVDSLTFHCLHHDMDPFFRHLALPLVGVPQREKNRLEEEERTAQAERSAEIGYDVSSPSAVAPLTKMSDEDFDLQTKRKHVTKYACPCPCPCPRPRSPRLHFIGKMQRSNKKTRDYKKGVIISPTDSGCGALNKDKGLEIMIEEGGVCEQVHADRQDWRAPRAKFCRDFKLLLFVDLLICAILIATWLAVCKGVNCMKRD